LHWLIWRLGLLIASHLCYSEQRLGDQGTDHGTENRTDDTAIIIVVSAQPLS
jgi:hypothetical protein